MLSFGFDSLSAISFLFRSLSFFLFVPLHIAVHTLMVALIPSLNCCVYINFIEAAIVVVAVVLIISSIFNTPVRGGYTHTHTHTRRYNNASN